MFIPTPACRVGGILKKVLGFLKPTVPRGRLRFHAGVDFTMLTGQPTLSWGTSSRDFDEDDDNGYRRQIDRPRSTAPMRYRNNPRSYHVGR